MLILDNLINTLATTNFYRIGLKNGSGKKFNKIQIQYIVENTSTGAAVDVDNRKHLILQTNSILLVNLYIDIYISIYRYIYMATINNDYQTRLCLNSGQE